MELRDVDEIRVENLASGAPAEYVTRSADGSFFALVPIQPGRNPIQVVARTTDGGVSAQKRIDVDFREDTDVESGAPSDPTLARARRELLERWLADVQKAEGAQAPETH